jgi:threonine dehydratase
MFRDVRTNDANVAEAVDCDFTIDAVRAALQKISPEFLDTPQLVDASLSRATGRELFVKIETLTPIGSFKARGASVLVDELDASRTWVCETAGNFGQGIAFLARERRVPVDVFVSPEVPPVKVERMRALGALVHVGSGSEASAREFAAASGERQLVTDGLSPAMAAGAGTIGLELAPQGAFDAVVVQVGDGALASGVACAIKAVAPATRVVGVCAEGAPAMAVSFAARRATKVVGDGTIATALAITEPVPASLARLLAYVDEIVTVDESHLRRGMQLIAESLGVLVEPAGAAGVAALIQHGARISGERIAVVLTGSGAGHPIWAAQGLV